jgi:TonB family protein
MTSRVAVVVALLWMLSSCAQTPPVAYQVGRGGTAVDTRGTRHTAAEYPRQHAPWNFADRIQAVAPDYPLSERASRHQGSGFFRVLVDPKTGTPTQVITLKSTGYSTLDSSAITALRQWRWKPGLWKEVDIPVTFQLTRGQLRQLPPDTIPLAQP